MKRRRVFESWTEVAIVAGIIAIVIAAFVIDGRQKDECRDNGGHVVQLHTRHGGWMCIEPRGAEREP